MEKTTLLDASLNNSLTLDILYVFNNIYMKELHLAKGYSVRRQHMLVLRCSAFIVILIVIVAADAIQSIV